MGEQVVYLDANGHIHELSLGRDEHPRGAAPGEF
jgi:hypothetical protein